jgi:hypothetical protein
MAQESKDWRSVWLNSSRPSAFGLELYLLCPAAQHNKIRQER